MTARPFPLRLPSPPMDLVRLATFALLTTLTLTLAVCTSASLARLPEGPPFLRGTLTEIRHSATASGLVVEPGNDACGLQATADRRTRVYRREPSGRVTPIGAGAPAIGALETGHTVSVWMEGPVLESCPMQGQAAAVVLETAPSVSTSDLVGEWVHVTEEDANGLEVYRRGSPDSFPPRMYRQRYVLHRGGRADTLVPHPADAHSLATGTWSLRDGVVTIRYESREDRLRVREIGPGVLRVSRESRAAKRRRPPHFRDGTGAGRRRLGA